MNELCLYHGMQRQMQDWPSKLQQPPQSYCRSLQTCVASEENLGALRHNMPSLVAPEPRTPFPAEACLKKFAITCPFQDFVLLALALCVFYICSMLADQGDMICDMPLMELWPQAVLWYSFNVNGERSEAVGQPTPSSGVTR